MLFNKIIGHEHAKAILTNLASERHFPPMLFVGPKGIGKRTMAINFAQIINCPQINDTNLNQCSRCHQIGNLTHFDVKLIFPIPQKRIRTNIKAVTVSDSDTTTEALNEEQEKTQSVLAFIGENISNYTLGKIRPDLIATNFHPIEIIHWLKTEMSYKPVIAQKKIIIIVDADKMRHDAANALLKTLEEPQQDTLFILTCERITSILPTIRSRCQIIRFSNLKRDDIIRYLTDNYKLPMNEAQIAASVSEGSIRKVRRFITDKESFMPDVKLMNMLDRSQTSPLDMLEQIFRYESDETSIESLISALLFVYRNAMYDALDMPTFYRSEITEKIKKTLAIDEITRRISFLLSALQDSSINLNKKLYLFSVLSAVRISTSQN